ncbi:hypothetical protein [Embleya sp. AB8]|uniref:hypothetical protein n=1 Tax=Embleya sp. AB8 TaxID=3156304 RepID=UPI003C728C6E
MNAGTASAVDNSGSAKVAAANYGPRDLSGEGCPSVDVNDVPGGYYRQVRYNIYTAPNSKGYGQYEITFYNYSGPHPAGYKDYVC